MTFSWQAQYFRQMEWKNRKTHWYEAVGAALNFPFLKETSQNSFVFDVVSFEIWGSLAELLRFWCCQVQNLVGAALNFPFLKETSQNSFVFDVVSFEIWGRLAELLRFWLCQVQKLGKSRRIASFWMLSTLKNDEVLQNSLVFKLADRQVDRQVDRQTER